MKGLEILLHSIRQVTANLDGALKVSALPYAIQVVAGLLLARGAGDMAMGMPSGRMGFGIGIGGLLALIVTLVTSLWIAVAWHRYILLSEKPAGYVPPFNKDRILAYFLRALVYGLALILAGLILGMIMGAILTPLAARGNIVLFMILMGVLVYMPIVILAFRLTAALPASALGTETDVMAGWRATEGATADIAVLAALMVGLSLLFGLIDNLVFSNVWLLSFLWGVVVGWLLMMVGISILTTLYGHYVEKRPLV